MAELPGRLLVDAPPGFGYARFGCGSAFEQHGLQGGVE